MKIQALVLALAALVLSGCYVSDRLLLDPTTAVHPFEDGVYARESGEGEKFKLTLEPDGWYNVESYEANGALGESHRMMVSEATLGGRDGYVLAEETDDGFEYALAFIEGDRIFVAMPDCSDSVARDDAQDHGGEPQDDEGMSKACLFKTHDALIAALSAFAGHADFGAPYQRR